MKNGQKRAGFTLMELAVVMAAMGLVLGSVWAVSSSVLNKYKVRAAHEQIVTVAQNIRNLYSVSGKTIGTIGSSANLELDKNMIFPIEMRVNKTTVAGNIRHAFGGDLTVMAPQADSFRLTLAKLKREDCINFLMTFPFLSPELGVCVVAVNNSSPSVCQEGKTGSAGSPSQIYVDPTNVTTPSTSNFLPFKITDATNACSLTNGANSVAIEFWKRN